MTNPDTNKYAELIASAHDYEGRLTSRLAYAPANNTYTYLKTIAGPDGSMECGYDAELDSRSAKCIRDLLAALAEMQGVVERLPMTKDGVRVIPGIDPVYREQHAGRGEYYITCLYEKATHLIEASYSSKEAALAAQRKK